jgi:hypothetical protein
MSSLTKALFCVLGLSAALLFVTNLHSQDAHAKQITVLAEKVGTRVSYKVNSRHVDDLLLALAKVADRNGANQPVTVLVDSRLPSAEIWNVDGVAGKAQLTNLRFFVFFSDTEKMSEIKRMPAVSFSTSPPVN